MIIWSNRYSVGLEEIDNQHKVLISIINKLEKVQTLNPNKPEFEIQVLNTFEQLTNYTVLHFATEEVLMKMFEYGDYLEHKAVHDNFVQLAIDKKQIITNYIKNKKIDEALTEIKIVLSFLNNWLINHIIVGDKEYSEFFLKIQKKAKKSGGWLSFLNNK